MEFVLLELCSVVFIKLGFQLLLKETEKVAAKFQILQAAAVL